MKKLFTACYGRARALPRDFAQVRTSRGIPEWWKPVHRIDAMPLAPTGEVLGAAKAGKSWQGLYRMQLEKLYRTGVLAKVIESLPENAVLMCFEANPRECHRSILAAFLNEKEMATVTEFVAPPPIKPPPPQDPQMNLL